MAGSSLVDGVERNARYGIMASTNPIDRLPDC
jgi:hypothetical protein